MIAGADDNRGVLHARKSGPLGARILDRGAMSGEGTACRCRDVEVAMSPPPTTSPSSAEGRELRFTQVATDVWEPLQRYLRRRADPSDVDDVAAETLTAMWRHVDDIPTGAELPWCYAIARRCLANHRRSQDRRRSLIGRITSRRAQLATGGDPAQAIEEADPDLHVALARLSADDREILTLWAWEQLSVGEIAVVLDLSPNAASVRLRRARMRLGDHLDDARRSGHVDAGCHIASVAGHTGDGCTTEAL